MSGRLKLQGVRFTHGKRNILDGVSFAADGGEFIALLGANGAGKSTLLDLISGFRKPASGSILVEGRELGAWGARELARQLSHLPQAVDTAMPFTAGQLVLMGRYPHADRWFESEDDARQVTRAMERTGCGVWEHRAMSTLSGGERQRVLLAACLAQDAPMLLLDEPSTYLDIDQQLLCFSLLREEADAGRLALAVTHDLNLALRFCTRLIVLAGGRVACDLKAAEAGRRADWLPLLSPRLRLGGTGDGSPWVWYR